MLTETDITACLCPGRYATNKAEEYETEFCWQTLEIATRHIGTVAENLAQEDNQTKKVHPRGAMRPGGPGRLSPYLDPIFERTAVFAFRNNILL